jgi:hypothetical protein
MQRVKGLSVSCELFHSIGNTGAAVDRCWNNSNEDIFTHHKTPALKALLPMKMIRDMTSFRHPDPSLTANLVVSEPELQISGSWKKISLQKKGGMKARLAFTSFIWNGKSILSPNLNALMINSIGQANFTWEVVGVKPGGPGFVTFGVSICKN